jgi:hypothetical protein
MKKIVGCVVASLMIFPFVFGACGGGGSGGSDKTVKLFGTTLGNGTLGDSILVQLSPDDGSFMSTIGSVGYYVNGLEYDATRHKLFGTTSTNDPNFPDGLIEISMINGAAATIGQAGITINNPTVDSSGDLYAWSEDYDWLITVDPLTGVATTVGDSGISTLAHGLAFDKNDILYMVNSAVYGTSDSGEIYTIDTATGAATLATTIGAIAHHGDFHPKTGMFWGLSNAPVKVPNSTRNLIEIDLQAPAIIDRHPTVDNLHAITFFYDKYSETELLTNGGFETGDLTGWTYADQPGSAGSVFVMASTVTPLGGYSIDSPTEGTYQAVFDQDDYTADAILQEFTVPAGDSDVSLTFDMFVLDTSGLGPINAGAIDYTIGSNQHARVDILSATAGTFDVGAGVVRNLYLGIDGYNPILPYVSYFFDLSSDLVPGETYKIRFAQTDNLLFLNMGIDNVSIRSK